MPLIKISDKQYLVLGHKYECYNTNGYKNMEICYKIFIKSAAVIS